MLPQRQLDRDVNVSVLLRARALRRGVSNSQREKTDA